MFSVPKISLGRSLRTYTHDMSFDNNTTMSIGIVQPLMSQYLSAGDKINVSLKQLVRLAPMPVPSFARLSLVNKVKFVPMADVFRGFESMLSRTPVYPSDRASYIPTSVPTITNRLLVGMLCALSDTSVTCYLGSPLKYSVLSNPSNTLASRYFLAANDPVIHEYLANNGKARNSDSVTPLNADYVLSKSSSEYYCVRLGRLGRILRAVLVGCGYSLNVSDRDNISVLPLFALYKAYFDSYAPLRDVTWTSTQCFHLIDMVFENGYTDLTKNIGSFYVRIGDFFTGELASLFATYEDDFLSIHRLSANTQNPTDITGRELKQPYGSLDTDVSVDFDEASSKTLHTPLNSDAVASPITLLSLQTLQRLQRFINKDSIIGKKVSDWLSVHFGAQVATDYFKNAYNIRDIVTRCDINDIFSTADTTGSDGDYLGAYGGKGLGFSDSGFSFHAPTFGFLFVIGAIMPKNGFYQGTDLSLYAKDRFTFPSADFDALGYELTPASVVRDDGGTDVTSSMSAFGFVPRFSGFKVKKDVVNGDMSRNSTKHQLSAYHLERMLTTPTYSFTKNADGSVTISQDGSTSIPAASQSWRYVSRYPWLGNYGRIFYNDTDNYALSSDPYDVDDQFIVQTVFDVKLTNKLKPLSESFDTYEESTDNSSTAVRAE